MHSDTRLFHRADPDFPTTQVLQQRLIAAGRVAGEGPLAHRPGAGKSPPSPRRTTPRPVPPPVERPHAPCVEPPAATRPASIPLGETDTGTLNLDLGMDDEIIQGEASPLLKKATWRGRAYTAQG